MNAALPHHRRDLRTPMDELIQTHGLTVVFWAFLAAAMRRRDQQRAPLHIRARLQREGGAGGDEGHAARPKKLLAAGKFDLQYAPFQQDQDMIAADARRGRHVAAPDGAAPVKAGQRYQPQPAGRRIGHRGVRDARDRGQGRGFRLWDGGDAGNLGRVFIRVRPGMTQARIDQRRFLHHGRSHASRNQPLPVGVGQRRRGRVRGVNAKCADGVIHHEGLSTEAWANRYWSQVSTEELYLFWLR